MPYGYEPLKFRKDLSGVRQAAQQFGQAVGQIPEMVELAQNKFSNQKIYESEVQPVIDTLSPEDISLTGFTNTSTLKMALKPEKGETNVTYAARVARALQPIAETKAKMQMAETERTRVRREGEAAEAKVQEVIPGRYESVPTPSIQPKPTAAPAGTPAPSEIGFRAGYGTGEARVPAGEEQVRIPGAETRFEIAQRAGLPYEELQKSGTYQSAPTESQRALYEYRSRKEERLSEKDQMKMAKDKQSMDLALERLKQGWARIGQSGERIEISSAMKRAQLSDMIADAQLDLDQIQSTGMVPEYGYDYEGKWGVVGSHPAKDSDYKIFTDKIYQLNVELGKIGKEEGQQRVLPGASRYQPAAQPTRQPPAQPKVPMTPQDQDAYQWAQQNPSDMRSRQIIQKLQGEGKL